MLCSSEDKVHSKCGPFYTQHCFTEASELFLVPDTRFKMYFCKAHASFKVSALYTEDHETCPPWNPKYIFGIFFISTANNRVFSVAKSTITSPHHCFSGYSSKMTQFTCKADAKNPYMEDFPF